MTSLDADSSDEDIRNPSQLNADSSDDEVMMMSKSSHLNADLHHDNH